MKIVINFRSRSSFKVQIIWVDLDFPKQSVAPSHPSTSSHWHTDCVPVSDLLWAVVVTQCWTGDALSWLSRWSQVTGVSSGPSAHRKRAVLDWWSVLVSLCGKDRMSPDDRWLDCDVTLLYRNLFLCLAGVRILQNLYRCSWDDETRESNGFYQFGYDGEDFLSFDLTTETWITSKPEAVATKHKLDHNYAKTAYYKNFFTRECIYWLKRYLDYGRSSLLRTGRVTWPDVVQQ